MGYSRYIGRIGALAVALGIGTAIGAPAIALADETGTDTAVSSNDTGDTDPAAERPQPDTETDEPEQEAPDEEEDGPDEEEAPDEEEDAPDEEEDPVVDDDEPSYEYEPEPEHEPEQQLQTVIPESSARFVPPDAELEQDQESEPVIDEPVVAEKIDTTTTFTSFTTLAAPTTLPRASVVVDSPPVTPSVWRPIRSVVLSVLDGLFGFDPADNAANPIAVALWGSYRRIESFLGNESPTITGAQVVGTSLTTDGKLAVTMDLDVSDYDGDPLTYTTTSGESGTLTRNADGTFTYLTDPDYRGTDTVTITASDAGPHFHGPLGFLSPGSGHATTASVAVTVENVIVIDAVNSEPTTGNSWVVTVDARDSDGEPVTIELAAEDPAHVGVTDNGDGSFTVTVTDTDWAAAHPGAQIGVIVTASTSTSKPVVEPKVIGTVNNAIALGDTRLGLGDVPALPAGVTYTQAAVGANHTVFLRWDGTVVIIGSNAYGQSDLSGLPELPEGVTYTQVAAGESHTVLLRSDGKVDAIGRNVEGQTNVASLPALPDGVTYTQVAAGAYHTVLLRSDGTVDAVGFNYYGQTNIPTPPDGVTYTQVAAGRQHTVLLRSDGKVAAIGDGGDGQTNVAVLPPLPPGVTYTQVSAGDDFTVLVRSDGEVQALGLSGSPVSSLPVLPPGVTYVQSAAGSLQTVVLRSDGDVEAVAVWNSRGEATIPALPGGVVYTGIAAGMYRTVLLSAIGTAV